eukprot:3315869-Pleurochrysis_carterae.AAC.1
MDRMGIGTNLDLITNGKEYLVKTCSIKAASVSSDDIVLVGIAVTKRNPVRGPTRRAEQRLRRRDGGVGRVGGVARVAS